MVALPGQVLVWDQWGLCLVRPHDDALGIDQLFEDIVVHKKLLLRADMLEWKAVGGIEVGVGSGVHRPGARPGLLHSPPRIDQFGFASRFRLIGLDPLVHVILVLAH